MFTRLLTIVCTIRVDSTLVRTTSVTLDELKNEKLDGTVFDNRYEIESIIGEGGMGKVYKARHKLMRRMVAIKVVHPHLVSSALTMARFQQEAEAASCLNHPNIVTVHDFGLVPRAYLVMDYLDGVCLSQLLADDACLSLVRSVHIFVQICAGLAHAHEHGVVHRDLKPSNIMLINMDGKTDFVKIVDFGIAKLVQREADKSVNLTATGEIFGSPLYMSPEQCRGKPMDARSDIYSLGCIMYRTLTGQQPIPGQDLLECSYNHVNLAPRSFKDTCPNIKIPDELEAIVLKCMAKKQEKRFQSMADLKKALDALVKRGMFGELNLVQATALSQGQQKHGTARSKDVTVGQAAEAGLVASATEASRAASAAEAGRAASAAEDSLAASAAEAGRAASAAESARAISAKEFARAISAKEAGRVASAKEAGRAASAKEAGRAASVFEAGLAASAAESERAAAAAESERAASATEPGSEASAEEISMSTSIAELGRSTSAAESNRAATAAESSRAAIATELALAASAVEAALAAFAAESALAASAHEAGLAASAREAGLAASAAEAERAASAKEAGRAAEAAEAWRAASAAEVGRAASAAEAGRVASAAEDQRAASDAKSEDATNRS